MKHSSFTLSWLLLIGAVAAMSSCTTYSYTSRSQQVTGRRISETPKVAEVEADFTKKITVIGDWAMSANAAKLSAEYKAIVENKIDVLVDPIYKITIAPVFNTTDGAPWYTMSYRAEATGFAGTYKRLMTQEEQINQLKDVAKSDIEKYKMLNEPEFYKYYYQSKAKQGDMNGNVIIGGGGAISALPAPSVSTDAKPAGLPILKETAPKKEVNFDKQYKQYNDMIKAGKAFVGIGSIVAGVGAICGFTGLGYMNDIRKKYGGITYLARRDNRYYKAGDLEFVSIIMCPMGVGMSLLIGTPCWAVGEKKLKALNGNLSLNYNVSPTGVNLALNF